MEFLKGYKTMILGALIGIIGTIKAFATPEDAANAPTMEDAEMAYDGIQLVYSWGAAIATWVIRAITNSPIFNKRSVE
jgi:hypothetical protein